MQQFHRFILKVWKFEIITFIHVHTPVDPTQPLGHDPDAPGRWNYTLLLFSLKLVEVTEPQEKVSVVMEVMEVDIGQNKSLELVTVFSIGLMQGLLGIKKITTISHQYIPDKQMFGALLYLHSACKYNWEIDLKRYQHTNYLKIFRSELVDLRDTDFRLVGITSYGMVNTYVSVLVSANCPMDVYKFPFDYQTCQIRFCIPVFTSYEVEIFNEIYAGVLTSNAWKTMVIY